MLGTVVAGLACWDRHQFSRSWYWLAAGWALLALGFALKVIAAVVLIPLLFVILRRRRAIDFLAACSTLLPALVWYLWADHLVGGTTGSRASADNRAIWLHLLGPAGLLKAETLKFVAWFLLVRAFTPLGVCLALYGLWNRREAGVRGSWSFRSFSFISTWLHNFPPLRRGVRRVDPAQSVARSCAMAGHRPHYSTRAADGSNWLPLLGERAGVRASAPRAASKRRNCHP